jgi:hypothetical protein
MLRAAAYRSSGDDPPHYLLSQSGWMTSTRAHDDRHIIDCPSVDAARANGSQAEVTCSLCSAAEQRASIIPGGALARPDTGHKGIRVAQQRAQATRSAPVETLALPTRRRGCHRHPFREEAGPRLVRWKHVLACGSLRCADDVVLHDEHPPLHLVRGHSLCVHNCIKLPNTMHYGMCDRMDGASLESSEQFRIHLYKYRGYKGTIAIPCRSNDALLSIYALSRYKGA